MYKYIFIFLAICVPGIVYSQTGGTVQRDTLLARELRFWKQKLSLDSQQLASFTTEYQQSMRITDSLRQQSPAIAGNGSAMLAAALKAEVERHEAALKLILNTSQWQVFNTENVLRKEAVNRRIQQRNGQVPANTNP